MTNFSSLWIGSNPGPYEKLSLKSAVANGYEMFFYSYETFEDLPSGILQLDANEIVPKQEVTKFGSSRHAQFSDYFRYHLLSKRDTTWIDSDVILISEKYTSPDYAFGYESESIINNAFLRYPAKSKLSDKLLGSVSEAALRGPWGASGPALLTKSINEQKLIDLAFPKDALYPIHYREIWKAFHPDFLFEMTSRTSKSISIHLWNEYLRTSKIAVRSRKPPKGSFIEYLFEKYACEPPSGKEITKFELQAWSRELNQTGIRWFSKRLIYRLNKVRNLKRSNL